MAENVGKNNEEKKSNYLGIMFKCCNIYGRIYKNKDGNAYVGRCPRCMRSIRIAVGEGGTNERFFSAL
ncbi:MAG: hypothetical protein WCG95_02700 [bacterium]